MTNPRLDPSDPAPFDLAKFLRQPLPDHPMDDDPDYLEGYDPALPPLEPQPDPTDPVSLNEFERAVLSRIRSIGTRPSSDRPLPSILDQDRAVLRALIGGPPSQGEVVARHVALINEKLGLSS